MPTEREARIVATLVALDLALVAQNAYFNAIRNGWYTTEIYDYILGKALVTSGVVMLNVNNLKQLSE